MALYRLDLAVEGRERSGRLRRTHSACVRLAHHAQRVWMTGMQCAMVRQGLLCCTVRSLPGDDAMRGVLGRIPAHGTKISIHHAARFTC